MARPTPPPMHPPAPRRAGGAAPRDDVELRQAVETALREALGERAAGIAVTVARGTVTVRGAVRGWIEHDEAIAAARATSGTSRVSDALCVLIPPADDE